MATKVGEGYVGISADTRALQTEFGALGASLGGKLGGIGQLLGGKLGTGMGKGLEDSVGGSKSSIATIAAGLADTGPIGIAVAGTVAAIGGATIALFKLGSDFQDQYRTIARATGDTGKSLSDLETAFKNTAKTSASSFSDITTAIVGVQRYTGPVSKQLVTLSGQFLDLSRISKTSVAENVEAGVKALENWNVATKNAPKALDELFTASEKSGGSFADLASQVTKFAPSLRTMGFSFADSVSMLAQFTKTGANTSQLMAALRLAATNLAVAQTKGDSDVVKAHQNLIEKQQALATTTGKTLPKAQQAYAAAQLEYLSAVDTAAKTAGVSIPAQFRKVIQSIKDAKNPTDALTIASTTFGKRGAAAIVDAVKTGKFNFGEMTKAVDGSRGSIEKMTAKTETVGSSFARLGNASKVAFAPLATDVFHAITRGLINLANALVPATNWIGKNLPGALQHTGNFVKTFSTVWAQNFRDVVQWIKDVYEDTTTLREVIGQTFTVAARLVRDAWSVIQPIFRAIGDAIKLVSDLLHGNWKNAWNDAVDLVQSALRSLANVPKAIFDALVSPFTSLSPKIQHAMDDVWTFLSSVPGRIGSFLAGAPSAVANAFSSAFQWAITGAISGLSDIWNWLKNLAPTIGAALATIPSAIFRAFSAAFDWAIQGAISGLSSIWGWLGGLGGRIVSAMANVSTAIFLKFVSAFGGVINGAVLGLQSLWGWLGGLASTIIGAMGNIGVQLFDAGARIFGKFADGIRSAADDVGSAASFVIHHALGFLPSSPAERGPLSGQGWADVARSGAALSKQFASGITQGTPSVNAAMNVLLGPTGATGAVNTVPGVGGGAGTSYRGGPAVVIQNASFSDQLDVESFLRQAAWVVQTRRI